MLFSIGGGQNAQFGSDDMDVTLVESKGLSRYCLGQKVCMVLYCFVPPLTCDLGLVALLQKFKPGNKKYIKIVNAGGKDGDGYF